MRTLVALRDSGNLIRAGQLLCLTQSALSHQIKLLETHFGAVLFERKSTPLQFTQLGQRLLTLADRVLPLLGEAERDAARLANARAGQLRIAIECHTCFDWLMPAMDAFRLSWPEVELDIVSGFHTDPIGLLHQKRADVAIVSTYDEGEAVDIHPLFRFEIVAILANVHRHCARQYLDALDFADETVITYPVPDEMLDLVRQVLLPAHIHPKRRTTELTAVMLQLVASERGIAALPVWAVQSYVERGYVTTKPITPSGLHGSLYLACPAAVSERAFLEDFVRIIRERSFIALPGLDLL